MGLFVKKNARKIAEYIQNQLKEYALPNQLTPDLSAPFTEGKSRNAVRRKRNRPHEGEVRRVENNPLAGCGTAVNFDE